ncbi:MAG: hypothetical protein GTO18_21615 [Anaerolineales bacterium]|nr:hypothetical protein [Anaerolineales bacterium]
MSVETRWKTRIVMIGGLLGTFIGLGAAYLLIQRAEREGGEITVSTSDGLKISLVVLGLLSRLNQIGEVKTE